MDVKSYCFSQEHLESNKDSSKFDWYYDLSSSRMDHLEMPVYTDLQVGNGFPQKVLKSVLAGSPLSRDVIPLESGETTQRGGCMVIINRNPKSFEPLAVQQHSPKIHFNDGTTSHSRRSDSYWCKILNKNRGLKIAVDKDLFVYHDNRFDIISSPSGVRRSIVQEVVGTILCRAIKWRKQYKDARLLEMRSWLARVKGILISFRNRPYCTEEFVRDFVTPLDEILESERWEEEVFAVVESTFDSLQGYEPNPADFAKTNFAKIDTFIKVDVAESKAIEKEWNRDRITRAHKVLLAATGKDGIYVGVGNEGVSFQLEDVLYKVFDLAHSSLLPKNAIKLLKSTYLSCPDLPPIMKRPFYSGTSYRGGHGLVMVRLLREWKSKNLYHTNLTPDNLLFNEKDQTLAVVDLGRDVSYERSEYLYSPNFLAMCKRAFLCFRFGDYASNPYALSELKQRMREDYSSLHLVGFDSFMRSVYDSEKDTTQLNEVIDDMDAVLCHVVSSLDDDEDDEVVKDIQQAIKQKMSEKCSRVCVTIEDPFHQILDGDTSKRRPLWFYRRHLRRLQNQFRFTIEEHTFDLVDPHTFQMYVGYYLFVLDFNRIALSKDQGCFLMIKSCPLEYQSILADVRRAVYCLESSTSFKSIVLVADLSKIDGFLRQYASIVDIDAYKAALRQIEDERLVDHIVRFDGKDSSRVIDLNETWLDTGANATHSSLGQHYASTFLGFEFIKEVNSYCKDDVVLQMDSDIIFHCENGSGIPECVAHFDDPKIVSFAFPILSRSLSKSGPQHLNRDGNPLRFEIRCSFVHLDRMFSMLPLQIPANEVSTEGSFVLKRGWWHVLDYNIQKNNMISGNHMFVSDLKKKTPWKKQLNQVNLQSIGKGWLQERHESIVVVIDLSNVAYGSALHSFEYLRRLIRTRKMFQSCGVILLDNGSTNHEDIISTLFGKGKDVFESAHLSTIAWRKELQASDLQVSVRSMCTNLRALVFISNGNDFDLHDAVCLLPCKPLQVCFECGSYYDETACQCYDDISPKFDDIPCTSLPIDIPSIHGLDDIQLPNAKFFASQSMKEGKLSIEISALVNGLEHIKGAKDVCVRIHSECLTGDVLYSQKCDCGVEKLQFLQIMAQEDKSSRPSILVYIKGHEGRGAGLCNKIKAYEYLDKHSTETHVDALKAIGCESDIRRYDAAVSFIKHKLMVKSIKLFTNNPQKIKAGEKYFGSDYTSEAMPAVPGKHNEKYLKEKVEILGHRGLL